MNYLIKTFTSSLMFLLSFSVLSETCKVSRTSIPGETKYVEQHSIKTDRNGHAVRIFKTETTFKKAKKIVMDLKQLKVQPGVLVIILLKMEKFQVIGQQLMKMEVLCMERGKVHLKVL